MKYDYRKTQAGQRRFNHPCIYKVTSAIQRWLWKHGVAVHNRFSDECTPDFNCCVNIGSPAGLKIPKRRAKKAVECDLQQHTTNTLRLEDSPKLCAECGLPEGTAQGPWCRTCNRVHSA